MAMIFIVNSNADDVLSVLNSNNSPNSTPFWNDSYIELLDSGTSSYEFDTFGDSKESKYLKVGNAIVFQDLDDDFQLLNIINVEDIHGETLIKRVYCEQASLQLLNQIVRPAELHSYNTKEAFEYALFNTGWELQYSVEDNDLRFENYEPNYENVLETLITLKDLYNVQMKFKVKFKNGQVTSKIIKVTDNIGKDTGKRFEYGKDIKEITRTVSHENYFTALIGIGNDGLDFKSVSFSKDEDGFYKPQDQDFVADYNQQDKTGEALIMGVYEVDTDEPEYLLRKTYQELQKRIVPEVSYTLDVALLERISSDDYEHEAVRIGDKIRVIDRDVNPDIIVKAQVVELKTSFTDSTQDSCTIANFSKQNNSVQSQINKVKKKVDKQKNKEKNEENIIHRINTSAEKEVIDSKRINNELKDKQIYGGKNDNPTYLVQPRGLIFGDNNQQGTDLSYKDLIDISEGQKTFPTRAYTILNSRGLELKSFSPEIENSYSTRPSEKTKINVDSEGITFKYKTSPSDPYTDIGENESADVSTTYDVKGISTTSNELFELPKSKLSFLEVNKISCRDALGVYSLNSTKVEISDYLKAKEISVTDKINTLNITTSMLNASHIETAELRTKQLLTDDHSISCNILKNSNWLYGSYATFSGYVDADAIYAKNFYTDKFSPTRLNASNASINNATIQKASISEGAKFTSLVEATPVTMSVNNAVSASALPKTEELEVKHNEMNFKGVDVVENGVVNKTAFSMNGDYKFNDKVVFDKPVIFTAGYVDENGNVTSGSGNQGITDITNINNDSVTTKRLNVTEQGTLNNTTLNNTILNGTTVFENTPTLADGTPIGGGSDIDIDDLTNNSVHTKSLTTEDSIYNNGGITNKGSMMVFGDTTLMGGVRFATMPTLLDGTPIFEGSNEGGSSEGGSSEGGYTNEEIDLSEITNQSIITDVLTVNGHTKLNTVKVSERLTADSIKITGLSGLESTNITNTGNITTGTLNVNESAYFVDEVIFDDKVKFKTPPTLLDGTPIGGSTVDLTNINNTSVTTTDLTVDGDTEAKGNLDVNGNLTVTGTTVFTTMPTLADGTPIGGSNSSGGSNEGGSGGTLNPDDFGENTDITVKTLSAYNVLADNAISTNNLTAYGTITTYGLQAMEAVTLYKTLRTVGKTSLNGAVDVSGKATFNSYTLFNNNVRVEGELYADYIYPNNIEVENLINTPAINTSRASINNNLYVSGTSTFDGAVVFAEPPTLADGTPLGGGGSESATPDLSNIDSSQINTDYLLVHKDMETDNLLVNESANIDSLKSHSINTSNITSYNGEFTNLITQKISLYDIPTSSASSNLVIDSYGEVAKSVSASKYKVCIEDAITNKDTDEFYKILSINPKKWYDKLEVENMSEAISIEKGLLEKEEGKKYSDKPLKQYYGLIAEDLHEAGLTQFVRYLVDNETGEKVIDGIEYDRVWTYLIPIIKELKEQEEVTAKKLKEQEDLIKQQGSMIAEMQKQMIELQNKMNGLIGDNL